jgi:hypothetical protein
MGRLLNSTHSAANSRNCFAGSSKPPASMGSLFSFRTESRARSSPRNPQAVRQQSRTDR